MANRLPHWRGMFLEAHALDPEYLVSALKWFDPLGARFAEHQQRASRPWLVAVNGSQGSGKSTLCDYLCALLPQELGLRCLALSLDDFYLTAAERRRLGEEVHPLLATRGVPGTHDMQMLADTLGELLAGRVTPIPRFDKAEDERRPPGQWELPEPPDVILLEGWCLGARAQSEAELAAPVNGLEEEEDPEGQWRRYVNTVLAEHFPPLYRRVDEWAMLQAPSFDCVYRWRLEQERKLAAKRAGQGVMSPEQVGRFIQLYQRLTDHCLEWLPDRVNHLFRLDGQRQILSYVHTAGAQP